jgi:hypothetical protein
MTVLSDESITTACEQQQPHGNSARAIHVPLFRPERRPLGVRGRTNEPSRSSGPFLLPRTRCLNITAGPGPGPGRPDRSMLPSVTYVFAARVPRRRTAFWSVCLSTSTHRPLSDRLLFGVGRSSRALLSAASCACDSRLAAACWVLLCFAPRRQSSHGYGTG